MKTIATVLLVAVVFIFSITVTIILNNGENNAENQEKKELKEETTIRKEASLKRRKEPQSVTDFSSENNDEIEARKLLKINLQHEKLTEKTQLGLKQRNRATDESVAIAADTLGIPKKIIQQKQLKSAKVNTYIGKTAEVSVIDPYLEDGYKLAQENSQSNPNNLFLSSEDYSKIKKHKIAEAKYQQWLAQLKKSKLNKSQKLDIDSVESSSKNADSEKRLKNNKVTSDDNIDDRMVQVKVNKAQRKQKISAETSVSLEEDLIRIGSDDTLTTMATTVKTTSPTTTMRSTINPTTLQTITQTTTASTTTLPSTKITTTVPPTTTVSTTQATTLRTTIQPPPPTTKTTTTKTATTTVQPKTSPEKIKQANTIITLNKTTEYTMEKILLTAETSDNNGNQQIVNQNNQQAIQIKVIETIPLALLRAALQMPAPENPTNQNTWLTQTTKQKKEEVMSRNQGANKKQEQHTANQDTTIIEVTNQKKNKTKSKNQMNLLTNQNATKTQHVNKKKPRIGLSKREKDEFEDMQHQLDAIST